MNVFTRIGTYIEKHWPEKMTTSDVQKKFLDIHAEINFKVTDLSNTLGIRINILQQEIDVLNDRVGATEAEIATLKNEIGTLKAQVGVKTRVIGAQPHMTPFAQRLPPVQPANANVLINGGIKSQQ